MDLLTKSSVIIWTKERQMRRVLTTIVLQAFLFGTQASANHANSVKLVTAGRN